jgi:hypothetical protein
MKEGIFGAGWMGRLMNILQWPPVPNNLCDIIAWKEEEGESLVSHHHVI